MARGRVHRPRQVDGRMGDRRRRREPGDDWCIVRLGVAGIVRGVDVETTHFRGNYPDACAIDACSTDPLSAECGDPTLLPANAAEGRLCTTCLRSSERVERHSHPIANLSGRRRGAAARLRRRRRGLGSIAAARRRRSRGSRAWRDGRRLQRHVLRVASQSDHARRAAEHGRWMGNEAPPRARPRLDDRQARRAGDDPAG